MNNGVIEQLDISLLIEQYSREGVPSYHPKMMLKVMVYAYMDNTYSSRKIEKAMRENINYMWLSGNQVADHNTIARFRLEKDFLSYFKQVVLPSYFKGVYTWNQAILGRYTFVEDKNSVEWPAHLGLCNTEDKIRINTRKLSR